MAISKVSLAGVTLDTRKGERQGWLLRSGGRSPRAMFQVSPKVDELLGDKKVGPIDLEIVGRTTDSTTNRSSLDSRQFTHLYLGNREFAVNEDRVVWTVFDIRAFFESVNVYATFNATRPTNQLLRFGRGNQVYFNQVAQNSYLPHTLMKGTEQNPVMGFANDSREQVRPWTAYNLVFWLLKNWMRQNIARISPPGIVGAKNQPWTPTVIVEKGVTDNRFVLNNFSTGRPWADVMDYALAKAQLLCYPDGNTFYVKSAKPIEIEDNVGGYSGAGVVIQQDTSRSSFRELRVITTKRHAVRYDFLDRVAGSILDNEEVRGKQDFSRVLRNVLALPQDVWHVAEGRNYRRGTYVTTEKALELWDQDPINNNPANFFIQAKKFVANGTQQLTKATVYPIAFRGQLVDAWTYPFYAINDAAGATVWGARANAFQAALRTIFQIPISHLDSIKAIELADVRLVDPITGTRGPVQIICDRFSSVSQTSLYAATLSHPAVSRPGINEFGWIETLQSVTDFSQLPFADGIIADTAKLTWVNKAFGVFKLSFDRDISAQFQDQRPFLLEPQDIPSGRRGPRRKGRTKNDNLFAAKTLDYWRMSIMLSVVWKTPNTIRQYYVQTYNKSSKPSVPATHFGPNVDIFANQVTADYGWVEGESSNKSVLVEDDDGVIQLGGELLNKPILDSYGEAVLDRAIFQATDRELGNFKSVGVTENSVPRGQIQQVEIFHQNGEVATVHYASDAPSPPQFKTQLSKDAQRVILREGAHD